MVLSLARKCFPESFNDVTPNTLAEAARSVEVNFIRVEADEVTYNLHVMMRFDLEREIIREDLAVADLPDAWNDRFSKISGSVPQRPERVYCRIFIWPSLINRIFSNLYARQYIFCTNNGCCPSGWFWPS